MRKYWFKIDYQSFVTGQNQEVNYSALLSYKEPDVVKVDIQGWIGGVLMMLVLTIIVYQLYRLKVRRLKNEIKFYQLLEKSLNVHLNDAQDEKEKKTVKQQI